MLKFRDWPLVICFYIFCLKIKITSFNVGKESFWTSLNKRMANHRGRPAQEGRSWSWKSNGSKKRSFVQLRSPHGASKIEIFLEIWWNVGMWSTTYSKKYDIFSYILYYFIRLYIYIVVYTCICICIYVHHMYIYILVYNAYCFIICSNNMVRIYVYIYIYNIYSYIYK
jgi:hypothetical protein